MGRYEMQSVAGYDTSRMGGRSVVDVAVVVIVIVVLVIGNGLMQGYHEPLFQRTGLKWLINRSQLM